MPQIQGSQIRAARAILNWSQEFLAQRTGLAVTTIRNIEGGMIPRGKTSDIIRSLFENSGIEFIEHEGVRRIGEEIRILYEPDSRFQLYDDMLQTLRAEGDEILAFAFNYKVFEQCLGLCERDGLARIKKIAAFARIKCLVPESGDIELPPPAVELRYTQTAHQGPSQYFVYGQKHALIMPEGRDSFRFVIFKSPVLALSYRGHFDYLWREAGGGAAENRRPKIQDKNK